MKKVEFIDEGVVFLFPDRIENDNVKKITRSKDFPADFPDPDELFKSSGYVVEYELDYADAEALATEGIELTVKYHTGHLMRAKGNIADLKLGINYRDGKKWINKTDQVYEKITYHKGKWRGAYKLIIKNPKDPVVAWGP